MPSIDITATWHKESYDRFLNEQLPQLLAERLPLAGYQVESTGPYTCRVHISVVTESGQQAEVTYQEVPQSDEQGSFLIHDKLCVVVPYATSEDLDQAEVLCVGDMLYVLLQERLGEAPPNLPWSESLLRAWLPLDNLIINCFDHVHPEFQFDAHFQHLDHINWLAKRSHLRRLFINLSDPNRVITPSQFGRLCPYEKPEGSNMGRIGMLALGATIRDKQVIIEDKRPEVALGLSMSVIPLVEHTDANRLLMGANMLRQWLPYDQPEPALVQTGNEPDASEFWCGRNLLTAFVAWGEETHEDGIILSQSGARHLSNPDHQVEAGDKLSNRYGMKGVVSRILPDVEMPKLTDGTPAELIFCSVGLHSRLTPGQLWEAVLGRLARAEGEPIIAPPFHGPSETEIKERLKAKGLPEDGMEHLLQGEADKPLPQPSLAGWLYWGRTDHLVRNKLQVTAESPDNAQRMTEMEYQMLRKIGATETIRELFHVRALSNIAEVSVDSECPTPRFAALQSRLAAAGIALTLKDCQLHCTLQSPTGAVVKLAQAVAHPWLSEHLLQQVGTPETAPDTLYPYAVPQQCRERQLPGSGASRLPEYETVVRTNEKLVRLIANKAPASLKAQAHAQLEKAVQNYFDLLLTADDLQFDSRVSFSGRTVLAPGAKLSHEQLGLAEEMAWTLFAPQVVSKLQAAGCRGEDEVTQRSARAEQALDEIMARSWVVLHRTPTVRPTAMIAFHPIRIPDKVVRIPSLACVPLDADFDGDQASIFLPITEAGQREADDLLSLEGHLKRDPALLEDLAPFRDPMLGLAILSLSEAGQAQISDAIGLAPDFTPGYLSRSSLIKCLAEVLENKGAKAVLTTLDQLNELGFATLRASGISFGPFVELGLEIPPQPPTDRVDLWESYSLQRLEQLLAVKEYEGAWGHYLLASKCGALAENRVRLLLINLLSRGVINDIHGKRMVIAHSLRQGLSPEEHFATVAGAQKGLRSVLLEWEESGSRLSSDNRSKSFHLLARARRSTNPGIVFARAAAVGEVDPLVDVDSRFFVGV